MDHKKVLDKGFVRLVGYSVDLADTQPDGFDDHYAYTGLRLPDGHTLDAQIVRASRVSYGAGTKSLRDDARLIRYLLRHEHGSPGVQVPRQSPHLCGAAVVPPSHRQRQRGVGALLGSA
jgi:thymidylate synthase ThyX